MLRLIPFGCSGTQVNNASKLSKIAEAEKTDPSTSLHSDTGDREDHCQTATETSASQDLIIVDHPNEPSTPDKCSICNLTFRNKEGLLMHKKKCYSYQGAFCKACKQEFRRDLKAHICPTDRHSTIQHPSHAKSPRYRILSCKICSEICSSKSDRKMHMVARHPELFCMICDKMLLTEFVIFFVITE